MNKIRMVGLLFIVLPRALGFFLFVFCLFFVCFLGFFWFLVFFFSSFCHSIFFVDFIFLRLPICTFILNKPNVEVSIITNEGATPIHYLVRNSELFQKEEKSALIVLDLVSFFFLFFFFSFFLLFFLFFFCAFLFLFFEQIFFVFSC